MRRLVLVALMVLLPLQFAWSAAAVYCQHETTPAAAKHFGHHEHVHTTDAGKASSNKLSVDSDCGVCHAGGLPVPMQTTAVQAVKSGAQRVAVAEQPALASALSRAPDRPQWLRLS